MAVDPSIQNETTHEAAETIVTVVQDATHQRRVDAARFITRTSRTLISGMMACIVSGCFSETTTSQKIAATPHQESDGPPLTYRLFVGDGQPACESFLSSLNASRSSTPIIRMCDIPVGKSDEQFSQPDWQTIDYKDRSSLIELMFGRAEYRYAAPALYYDSVQRSVDFTKGYLEPLVPKVLGGFERGEARLQKAQFDADNDGDTDIVYRMTSWQVSPSAMAEPQMPNTDRKIVFDHTCGTEGSHYRYILADEETGGLTAPGLSQYLGYDGYFVLYEGKTYFGMTPWDFSITSVDSGQKASFFVPTADKFPDRAERCAVTAVK